MESGLQSTGWVQRAKKDIQSFGNLMHNQWKAKEMVGSTLHWILGEEAVRMDDGWN